MKNESNKQNKQSFSDRVGNAVENVGKKVAAAGAPKLGQKIHDLGDKIEKTHTNPQRSQKH